METAKATTIDEYISRYPLEIQQKLQQIRDIIQTTAPLATEKISYGMPTFYLNGNLVYFAAHTHHLGFYPMAKAIIEFQRVLEPYKTSKGAIQFPYKNPLPAQIIGEIVKFRAMEVMNKPKKR